MGLPKRRVSKARKRKRRAIWYQKEKVTLVACPQCHELKPLHQVCPYCGTYRGKVVLAQAKEK